MPSFELIPFAEAIQSLAAKELLPTNLGSGAIRRLDRAVRQRSLFSARTMFDELLAQYKADIGSILNPTLEPRPDRATPENPLGLTTTGMDPATARRLVAETLRGNAEVLLQSDEPLDAICKGVTTPGGITEQLLSDLGQDGALDSWHRAMTRVLHRMAPARKG